MCAPEEVEGKGERGGGLRWSGAQILKSDLVCTDTGREGGIWSIHLESRSTVVFFFFFFVNEE